MSIFVGEALDTSAGRLLISTAEDYIWTSQAESKGLLIKAEASGAANIPARYVFISAAQQEGKVLFKMTPLCSCCKIKDVQKQILDEKSSFELHWQ